MKAFPFRQALLSTALTAGLCTTSSAENKYVKAFFESKDPFIQNTVLANIEKHRKGTFEVKFAGDQPPAADSQVEIELVRHHFHFGAAPFRQLEKKADLQKMFFDVFEFGVVENGFKWSAIERKQGAPNYVRTDALVEQFEKRDLPIELHFLTGYHPAWLNDKADTEKGAYQKRHAINLIERYQDSIEYFQVYNEIWHAPITRAKVFFDSKVFFQELTSTYPNLKFGISDCFELATPLPHPQEVRKRFPGIDFVSIHAHKPRRLWASPEQIYHGFNPWLNSGLKVHVTEFGLLPGKIEGDVREGTWDEELAAEYFVSTVTTVFSHEVARAMNFWGCGPYEKLSFPVVRMVRTDGSFTPAYEAMQDLIKRKLTTRKTKKVKHDSSVRFRGFYGKYQITHTLPDGSQKIGMIDLTPDQRSATISF